MNIAAEHPGHSQRLRQSFKPFTVLYLPIPPAVEAKKDGVRQWTVFFFRDGLTKCDKAENNYCPRCGVLYEICPTQCMHLPREV